MNRTRGAAARIIRILANHGLLLRGHRSRAGVAWWPRPVLDRQSDASAEGPVESVDLQAVAEKIGAAGFGRAQKKNHATQREGWRRRVMELRRAGAAFARLR